MSARRLETRAVEKVWGRDALPEPFAAPEGKRIGEIWFEPPPELDGLLAKYLFTSARLSVQVHPDDAAAPPGCTGKDEGWLVLDAEPGAQLAVGLREGVSAADLRQAALDGSILELLSWKDAPAGTFVYLPAGTIHAIGGGLSLVEIQQNSDITYRLYDYGRPRELHLEEALAVAHRGPHPANHWRNVPWDFEGVLADGPKFALIVGSGMPRDDAMGAIEGSTLVLPLEGEVNAEGKTAKAGECLVMTDIAHANFSGSPRWLAAAMRYSAPPFASFASTRPRSSPS